MVVKSDNFFQQCISGCGCRAVVKDPTTLNYVSVESCLLLTFQHLHLKSLAAISFIATFWRFLGDFQELSVRSVKASLHFLAVGID
jgi:hypothetical protein